MPPSLAAALLAGALALWLEPRLTELPAAPLASAELRLPPEILRFASSGYEAVLADWYWLEAIQYYGTRDNADENFRRLPALLEAATDLDPDFGYAYVFGGNTIPKADENKKWHNTGAAIRLLEKGMASPSDRWEIPALLAYNLFTYRGEYAAAARYMQEASLRPHAPNYLSTFVAVLAAQSGGDVRAAIDFTAFQLQYAPDHWTRDDLQTRLEALRLQDSLNQLNAALRHRREAGLPVGSVADLLGPDSLPALPVEPYGGAFRIQGDRVVSSDDDKLLHLFVHPGDPPIEPYVD